MVGRVFMKDVMKHEGGGTGLVYRLLGARGGARCRISPSARALRPEVWLTPALWLKPCVCPRDQCPVPSTLETTLPNCAVSLPG